jgi:hypothetical protein
MVMVSDARLKLAVADTAEMSLDAIAAIAPEPGSRLAPASSATRRKAQAHRIAWPGPQRDLAPRLRAWRFCCEHGHTPHVGWRRMVRL